MDESLKELGETIVGALAGAVSAYTVAFGQLTLDARAANVVCRLLWNFDLLFGHDGNLLLVHKPQFCAVLSMCAFQ